VRVLALGAGFGGLELTTRSCYLEFGGDEVALAEDLKAWVAQGMRELS
jgi:hypothetical protein